MRKRSNTSPPVSTERNARADTLPFESRVPKDDSTRGRILTSAERLFAELGFNGVSMPMIASASGITAGAIYKHFENKADLFFEVVQRTVQSIPVPKAAEGKSDATLLPHVVAMYSTRRLKLLRQLAVEVHYASVDHPRVRKLLRRSLDANAEEIRDSIVTAQAAGRLDAALDSELLASTVLVFTMGMMHMETIAPNLVGDEKWHDFVKGRVASLLGLQEDSGDTSE